MFLVMPLRAFCHVSVRICQSMLYLVRNSFACKHLNNFDMMLGVYCLSVP